MGLLEIIAAVTFLSWKIATLKWMVSIIGLCGVGRVGKTTIVKNLSNELLRTIVSGSKLSFGLMVWFAVPKSSIDIVKVRTKITNRKGAEVDTWQLKTYT